MESRDFFSVSRLVYASVGLGLEGLRSYFSLKDYRSRSEPTALRLSIGLLQQYGLEKLLSFNVFFSAVY